MSLGSFILSVLSIIYNDYPLFDSYVSFSFYSGVSSIFTAAILNSFPIWKLFPLLVITSFDEDHYLFSALMSQRILFNSSS